MAKKKTKQRASKAPSPELARMAAKKLLGIDNPSPQEIGFATLMIESVRSDGPTAEEVAEVLSAGVSAPQKNPNIEKILSLGTTKEFMETTIYQSALMETSKNSKKPDLPLIGRMLHVYPQDYGNIMAFPLEVSLASGKTLLQNTKEEAAIEASRGALGVIYFVGIPLLRNNIALAVVADAQGDHTTFCVGSTAWLEITDPLATDKLDNIARQASRARLRANEHGDTQNTVISMLKANGGSPGQRKFLNAEQIDMLRETACDAVREAQAISYLALQSTISVNQSQQKSMDQKVASTAGELKAKLKQRERESDLLQNRIKTLERKNQLLAEEKAEALARATSCGAANDASMIPLEERLAAIFL